jgi:hypothetical protein
VCEKCEKSCKNELAKTFKKEKERKPKVRCP